jgi:hypothetical protein
MSVIMLIAIMLSVVIVSFIILSVIIVSSIVLSFIKLSSIIMCVVAPKVGYHTTTTIDNIKKFENELD